MALDWTKWSIPLGSCLFGIPIRLHLLWPVFLGLQLLTVGLQVGEPWKGCSVLYWFLLLGPVLLATVLIHELGHSLAARCVKGHADGILLWPLGGLALCGHNSGPKADLWVSAAGPLTHLPMTAAWLAGLYGARVTAFGTGTPLQVVGMYPMTYENLALNICNGAVLMNITIFAFNLLIPAYPLDGGRIFVDLLLICRVRPRSAAIAAVVVSMVLSVGIIVYGCIPPVNAMLVLIAVFIFLSALQLAQAVRMGTLRTHPMFAYKFAESGPDACPPDLAPGYGGNGNAGSSLPVVGGPPAQGYPAVPPPGYPGAAGAGGGGNPFAAQPGAAAAVQQAPPYYAQHAAYAPAVAPAGGAAPPGWGGVAPPPPPPAR